MTLHYVLYAAQEIRRLRHVATKAFYLTPVGPVHIRFAASYSVFSAELSLKLNKIYYILNDRLSADSDISFQIGITEKSQMYKIKYRYCD